MKIGPDLRLKSEINGMVVKLKDPVARTISIGKEFGFEFTQMFSVSYKSSVNLQLNEGILKDLIKISNESEKTKKLEDYIKNNENNGKKIIEFESEPVQTGTITVQQIPGRWRVVVDSNYGKFDSEPSTESSFRGQVFENKKWLQSLNLRSLPENLRKLSGKFGQHVTIVYSNQIQVLPNK